MIESVGYTEDGKVFVNMLMEVRGEKMQAVLMLEEAFAREMAKNLILAADKAKASLKAGVLINEPNSARTN